MNITPLRAKLLEYLVAHDTIEGQEITYRLVGGQRRWSAQGATRWGCGFIAPMIKAGLVNRVWNRDARNIFHITDTGRKAWRELPPPTEGPL